MECVGLLSEGGREEKGEEDSQLKVRGSKGGMEKERREHQWTGGGRSDKDKGQQ